MEENSYFFGHTPQREYHGGSNVEEYSPDQNIRFIEFLDYQLPEESTYASTGKGQQVVKG